LIKGLITRLVFKFCFMFQNSSHPFKCLIFSPYIFNIMTRGNTNHICDDTLKWLVPLRFRLLAIAYKPKIHLVNTRCGTQNTLAQHICERPESWAQTISLNRGFQLMDHHEVGIGLSGVGPFWTRGLVSIPLTLGVKAEKWVAIWL
jgi:hypothetical protein